MRPQTNAEIAKALELQSAYATDSEAQWLMKEAAKRLAEASINPLPKLQGDSVKVSGTTSFEQPAEAAPPESQPAEEQNAPAFTQASGPKRVAGKKSKPAS